MSTSSDWTLNGLDNPQTIQHALLTRFENQTGAVVVDNNNPACVLMESFASMSSQQMKMMDDTVRPAIYPARAVTTEDLLKHISDYDYVDIFSAPCTATILLIVEKNYIITHSLDVPNQKYKRLEIPRSTIISIGEHKFGLYYPIEFRSDMNSGRFSVLYDTTVENPLKTLETNVLDFEFREYNGHKLAYIKVPVYQFDITSHDLTMVNSSGFKQKVAYSNRFYALRCWAEVLQNYGHDETVGDEYKRQELGLSVAGQTYDPTVPTVVFTPDEENKECLLEIPYIYFTEKRIRGTLHVEIYTTEGALNYQVPYNTSETCVIDMFSSISEDEDATYNATYYAEPFRTMPALNALPLSSTISGGSNGLTFEQIRYRVINGVNTTVLQTPADISAYFAAYGYTATLYRDGITDRIFIVHTAVRDPDNEVIGMDCISTQFDFRRLDEYGTIVAADDGGSTYTVLPSTLYKFDTDKQICVPLTDTERSELAGLSPADRVDAYNNNVFTLSPFHLQIDTSSRYPTTISYDMLQVKRMARTFIAARDDQYGLALNSVNLDVDPHNGDVKSRYRLTFKVSRIGFDSTIPVAETSEYGQAEKKIRVLVGLKNDDGELRWAEAQHFSTEAGDSENSTNEVFELILTPNYIFHQANNEHTVQMAFWDDDTFTDFNLTSECRVLLMMKNNIIISTESGEMITFSGDQCLKDGTAFSSGQVVLPTSKRVALNSEVGFNNYFVMTEQKCVFKFGSPIDELDQRINLTYSEAVYKKHLTTKFRTLDDDRYLKNEKGELILEYTYTRPKHKYISEDITYYVKEDDRYVLAEIPSSKYNTPIADFSRELYIRSVTPTIQLEYKKGTLTCMTVRGKELVTPNKYTASNYLDCTKVEDVEGEQVETKMTKELLDAAVKGGVSLSLKDSPTTPRFKVTNAKVSGIIGDFELKDAIDAKPISSFSNVWAKVGYVGSAVYTVVDTKDRKPSRTTVYYVAVDPSVKPITYRVANPSDFDDGGNAFKPGTTYYTLEVESRYDSKTESFRVNDTIVGRNALLHVMQNLVTVREATTGEDPLNDMYNAGSIFEPGTFLLLQNDYSTPSVVQVGTIGVEPTSKVYTRLYYKFRTRTSAEITSRISEKYTWICICQGKSKNDIIEALIQDAREDTVYEKTTDTNRNLTKTYYVKDDDTYREAISNDFNDDGGFKSGTTYYEKKVYNPKYYGFCYTLDQVRGNVTDVTGTDDVHSQLYISFLTTSSYKSRIVDYGDPIDTTTETVVATKTYYVKDENGFRVAKDSDFNADGSFINGVSYYLPTVISGTYSIPDFERMEKSAWEAHEIKVESTDVTVVEGRRYCYLDKTAYDAGIMRWRDLEGTIKGHPISEYISLSTDTGDGKLYYKKSMADCTDGDYAWEQNANRWPWEMKNWKMITKNLASDNETINYLYLSDDAMITMVSDYDRAHRYWEYSSDQVILNERGYPVEDFTQPRSIQYLVDMLQMDAKHNQVTIKKEEASLGSDFGDDGPEAHVFPTTIVKVLRTHFDNVGKARDTMFTNTRLFFEPVKSLGFASFNIGNNITRELPLDITMKFRLHVTKEAYEDDILLEQMKEQIISIIDTHIDGGYVNCAEIASKIVEEMDGTVVWVDILGINGDPDLQTMKCDSEDVLPHLSHKLTLASDGVTIDLTRGLTIEAVMNS